MFRSVVLSLVIAVAGVSSVWSDTLYVADQLAGAIQTYDAATGEKKGEWKITSPAVGFDVDGARVTWLDRGTEASLIAEEIGVAAAKRLGFKRCSGASLGPGGNEQRWVRS